MISSRLARLLWLGFALAVLALTLAWAYRVTALPSIDEQRAVVPVSTVWGMHACVIAILAGLGGIALPLVRILGRRRCLTALALAVAGFFDEHIYAQIGQTIAHTGRAESANYARVEFGEFEMYNAVVNKQPNGLPYLLSWVYRIAGVSDNSSHFLNRALIGLAAACLYLGLALVPWTLPAGAGLAAALLFIFTPLVMWWGHTVAVEPTAAATTALAFFAVCVHARLRDPETAQGLPASGLVLAGATAFAAYFRPESLLAFPMVAAVLWSTAVAGALWLLGRNRTAGVALGTWFAFSWGIFVLFYAGGYYYGASSRYGVVSCAPFAIFMGIGLAALFGILRRRPILLYGAAACGLVNWVAAMHYVPTLSREAVEAQADVDFVAKVAPMLPSGSIVLTPDPCIWMLQGKNASQIFTLDLMVHQAMRELARQYPGGVYLHWSFWHNAEPNLAREAARLIVETNAIELARAQSFAHKDALFRIDTPEAFARFGGPLPPPLERDTDLDRMLGQARAAAAATPAPAAK